jgi:hypothetical protein
MKSPSAARDVACFQPVNADRMDANLLGPIEATAMAFMPEDHANRRGAIRLALFAPQQGESY